ncbi:MAG TPA: hypothetical protein VF403_03725 [Kofleriaceae bacterium]
MIALGLLVGCAEPTSLHSTEGPRPEVAQTQPPIAVPRANAAQYHMQHHFDDLQLIEHLLIAGKLDDGATLAYLLVREVDDPELAAWQIETKRVTRAAAELTRAIDLDEALRREAVVAAECAACHLRSGARVIFPVAPTLPEGPAMAQHAWASDRLWEAVIGNDVDRWRRGLAVLGDSPISGSVLQTMARDQLAAAAAPPDSDARAIAYGKILIVCADCHTKLGAKLP